MKPKKVLFLDDRSKRLHGALKKYAPPEYDLTLVCTVKECIKMLSNDGPWNIVSLDHDLGFEEFVDSDRKDCGMEVVRWFRTRNEFVFIPPLKIIIHTSNEPVGKLMESILKRSGYLVGRERFKYD